MLPAVSVPVAGSIRRGGSQKLAQDPVLFDVRICLEGPGGLYIILYTYMLWFLPDPDSHVRSLKGLAAQCSEAPFA